MANSKFHVWVDTASSANTLDAATFTSDTQRVNGFQAGQAASSIRVNTILRECSLIAKAIADYTGNTTMDGRSTLATVKTAVENKLKNCETINLLNIKWDDHPNPSVLTYKYGNNDAKYYISSKTLVESTTSTQDDTLDLDALENNTTYEVIGIAFYNGKFINNAVFRFKTNSNKTSIFALNSINTAYTSTSSNPTFDAVFFNPTITSAQNKVTLNCVRVYDSSGTAKCESALFYWQKLYKVYD